MKIIVLTLEGWYEDSVNTQKVLGELSGIVSAE